MVVTVLMGPLPTQKPSGTPFPLEASVPCCCSPEPPETLPAQGSMQMAHTSLFIHPTVTNDQGHLSQVQMWTAPLASSMTFGQKV